ncbi:hypothetical protein KIM372_02360 [Bombiscardovia nodaiensis]|uniref:Uncharacterized protein n=1 Tax=Bombiscardovia nodaiensis TaxID=2932181 RepID=A0ABN6SAA5_9BIFI|nr:hypothetical protein KIM372_02360 [Bombiscardovia nodaiensis]
MGNAAGSVSTILNESYGWSGDTYKTRPTMEFQRTVNAGPRNITGNAMFSSHAIGVYGDPPAGPDGEKPLTVYFWCDNSGNNQSYISPIPSGYIAVMRATSGPTDDSITDVYMGIMPTPGNNTDPVRGWVHGPGDGDLWSTGGEVSQATGYLYTSSHPGTEIDNMSLTSLGPTYSPSQYCIWDPVTGNYSLSHLVQPGDWSDGMTTPSLDRWMLRRDVGDTSTGPINPNGSAQAVMTGSTTASADMGMDALGNMYLYYGGDAVPAQGTSYNAGIVKIVPSADNDGNIPDGSKASPWRYTTVTKVRSQLGESWDGAGSMWGVGIRNGKFLIGTTIGTRPGPGEIIPGTSSRQSRLVRIDPLSGLGKIMGSSDNALGRNNSSTYIPAVNYESFDMASAQELEVIQGTLYNDVDGGGTSTADGAKPEHAQALAGQRLVLYDENKQLIGSTTSSAKGTYSFIVSENGQYSIRVTQPGVIQPDGSAVAAHQTWGASTSGSAGTGVQEKTNLATVRCRTGDIVNSLGRSAGACLGTLEAPYIDKNPEALGGVGVEGEWPFYGIVTIQTSAVVPVLDFGFSTRGSYGDASMPPFKSTIAQKGPVLQSADQNDLRLGSTLGFYNDGTNDPSANAHVTDDGVMIRLKDGSLSPLQGAALARGHSYDLNVNVGGRLSPDSKVSVWHTNTDGSEPSGPVAADTTTGDNTVSIDLPMSSGSMKRKQIRAIVTPKTVTPTVDDTSGIFARHLAGAASNNTQPWTVPGEVEDYSVYTANTLVRLQVRVNNGAVPAAPFTFALTNIDEGHLAADNPSHNTDSLRVSQVGTAVTSPTVHSVTQAAAGNPGVKITDTTDKSQLGGEYSISTIDCHGTTDNAPFPTAVSAFEGNATVTGIAIGSDVTCRVDYDNHARFQMPPAGGKTLGLTIGLAAMLLALAAMTVLGLRFVSEKKGKSFSHSRRL